MKMRGWTAALAIAAAAASAGSSDRVPDAQTNARRHRVDVVRVPVARRAESSPRSLQRGRGWPSRSLSPDQHLGGMVPGGLGWTDYGRKQVIGGYALEFFERVGREYGREVEWHFEPHVAEAVFNDLITDARVQVFRGERLREGHAIRTSGTKVTSIETETDAAFRTTFDASHVASIHDHRAGRRGGRVPGNRQRCRDPGRGCQHPHKDLACATRSLRVQARVSNRNRIQVADDGSASRFRIDL